MKTPRLFTSNRVEHLVEALAVVLRTPLSSPFHPEVIVVQSKGMERYLSMQLAQRLGIWANCRYPFPNVFVEELFRAVVPSAGGDSPFEPGVLAWRIMKALPSLIGGPGFEALRLYLKGEEEDLRRMQLSAAIADVFDQYLLFRPDMIFRWERGEEGHWQARLWNHLSKGAERRHRAALAREFVKRLQNPGETAGLQERVCVFGISALPRFHMEILTALSRFTEVNLFVMNPCKEYWGDMRSEDSGLLPSLGRLGREFIDLVIELGWEDLSFFDQPGEETLLHSMQSGILNLKESGERGERRMLSDGDRSVQFHVCHSPMREVEVLRDRILDMLGADHGLKAGEILVMTPDIRTYAPYIQAVFDIPPSDPTYVPFSIADRGVREESRVIEPLMTILDLAGSRFGASQVVGILECHSVCRRFGLEEKDLDVIRRWVRETRIRWGMDAEARVEAGVPRFPENTWRAGLDRLLLGYAMPGGDERMFWDILPYDRIEGSEAFLLGRFVEFIESLHQWVKLLDGRRRVGEWADLLSRAIDRFFDSEGETERELRVLGNAIGSLGRMASPDAAGYDELIDLKAIRWHLARTLEKEGFGTGFLRGGITFCAMLPMRSIPCKVLCLIGMNGNAYPRESHAPGFDLIRQQQRPGDRSRRNDDRYLFLEAILSARERLYISYVGRSIQDNSAIPPSVLISELEDYIDERYRWTQGGVADHLLTVHGLQPFSTRYFRNQGGLFSYSEEHCAAARNLEGLRSPPIPFIGAALSVPEPGYRTVDLSDLCSFYSNPARYLLQRRIGLYLEEELPFPEDREPVEIKGIERYKVEQTMMDWALKGRDPDPLFDLMRASGQLPPGRVGECLYEELRSGVEGFVQRAGPHVRRDCLEDLPVDQRIGVFRLMGRIEGVNPADLVRYRYARLKGSDFLRTWILHLALNRFAPGNYPRTSRVIGLDGKRECAQYRFSPVVESENLLRKLLEIYWAGLTSPLHFFPESSRVYARSLELCGKDVQEPLRKARKSWWGSEWERGECEDSYYRRCFGERDVLDNHFEDLSKRIFQPLLGHMNEMKG